jgi:hypothetical protein
MAGREVHDIRAILEENGLSFRIDSDGPEYTLTDWPMETTLALQKAKVGDDGMTNAEFLKMALAPAGVPAEVIDKQGNRALTVLVALVMDFLVAAGLVENLPISPAVKAAILTGLASSATSLPSTQDTP